MTNIDFDERSVREVNVEKQAAFECRNHAIQGDAIMGVALQEKGVGVVGKSDAWMAVVGMSKTYQGVHGMVESGIGVVGSNNGAGTGVWGLAPKGTGIRGESVDGVGVYGSSDKNAGVVGESVNWYGVYGFSKPEHIGGVLAEGGRYALVARNGKFAAARIEGDCEVTGDIRLLNADCAEDFDIVESEENVEAGTVMVLNENGSLQSSYQEYDKKVAGIISGASGYKPAIVLDRQQDQNKKNKDRLPIALMGKVYCKVDARHSSIEIGDLLTTSATKGYAMKALDPTKAFGAVIGKSLGSIKEGIGMIPVLVALQ